MKAFGYIRVSGLGQVAGDGPIRQRQAIEEYAAKQGIEIAAWFEEKGVCGATEWENRPAWSEMVEKLNGVQTIVVERLDRLARELMIQEYILRDLSRRDVRLLTAAGEDTGNEDPTRVLFRQIIGAISQYDRVMTVRKLRGARQRKRLSGRCEGVKPYGTLGSEAIVVMSIMEMYKDGMTRHAIAQTLNDKGIAPRSAERWYPSTVGNIIVRERDKPEYARD